MRQGGRARPLRRITVKMRRKRPVRGQKGQVFFSLGEASAAAAFAGLLGIKPVLRIYGEKLDAFAKARGMKNAKKVMIKAITDDIEKNYGGVKADGSNAWLGMAYTHNLAEAEEFKAEVAGAFPNYHIDLYPLSLSISCHIGPGALAVTCTKPLEDGRRMF